MHAGHLTSEPVLIRKLRVKIDAQLFAGKVLLVQHGSRSSTSYKILKAMCAERKTAPARVEATIFTWTAKQKLKLTYLWSLLGIRKYLSSPYYAQGDYHVKTIQNRQSYVVCKNETHWENLDWGYSIIKNGIKMVEGKGPQECMK